PAAPAARPEGWEEAEGLGREAEEAWVRLSAGGDPARAEAARRELASARAEAAGPGSAPLERLLADAVGLTRLPAGHADAAAGGGGRGLPPAQAKALGRRQDRAQRRHAQAARALALVRKLLGPDRRPGRGAEEARKKSRGTGLTLPAIRRALQHLLAPRM